MPARRRYPAYAKTSSGRGPRGAAAPLAAVAALLAMALAGCGGGGSPATAAGAPAATAAGAGGGAGAGRGSSAQAQRILDDYGQCVRTHGFPDFPDPRIDANGELVLGAAQDQVKQAATQTEHACGNILRQLPPRAGQQSGPLTPAQLAQARLFSACMRQHGLPGWPDPRPDGTFPLSTTPYAHMGKTGPVFAGIQACRRYDTFGGVRSS
ncbi:MAG TPA: hypothetical protein VKV38_18100 [Trebonia sp.]|jgi:hypothetical protein|nr:hypothetical protein [Trebonia sp.]